MPVSRRTRNRTRGGRAPADRAATTQRSGTIAAENPGAIRRLLGPSPVGAAVFAIAFVLIARAVGLFEGTADSTGFSVDLLATITVLPVFLFLCRLFVHGKEGMGADGTTTSDGGGSDCGGGDSGGSCD